MSKNSVNGNSRSEIKNTTEVLCEKHQKVRDIDGAQTHLIEKKIKRIYELRRAIKDGLESGVVENFNAELHLKALKANKHLEFPKQLTTSVRREF